MDLAELASELLRRRDLDQEVRKNAPGGRWTEQEREQARVVDADNTRWLAAVAAEYGWPRISDVGLDAAHAAWLIAQHADADPVQQRIFLALMRDAVADGEARLKDLAYLEDRCLRNVDQPQLYGTQLVLADDGEIAPAPLAEPQAVDERRAAVGLGSLADYLKLVRDHNQ
ncbi:DUF6624 domain-containing protein [Actinoallomurus acaciae]|uniref:DUF6624 domain-containing protein n=1 Tax=Actinoallomurus acaciae TaxID=502577 RepID=A0ABV5Y8I5_9ACTN